MWHWTDHFAATGVVYGEVVHHLRVQSSHVNLWFFVVWPITNWALHSYEGTVVLKFNRDHRRTKTSCIKWQKKHKCWWLGNVPTEYELALKCVIFTYCLTLGRISSSGPIWMIHYRPWSELWQSIPAPRPTSHDWGRTSTALCQRTAARSSNAPACLCCRVHCGHSCGEQEGGDQSVTRQPPQFGWYKTTRVEKILDFFSCSSSIHKPSLMCIQC